MSELRNEEFDEGLKMSKKYIKITNIFNIVAVSCLIAFFVFIIIGIKTGSAFMILFAFALFGIGSLAVKIAFERGVKYCSKCKAMMEGCEYQYRSVRSYDKKDSNNVKTYRMVEVEIIAVCPDCGKTKKFKKEFKAYNYQTREEYDVQYYVDEYCMKKFGH